MFVPFLVWGVISALATYTATQAAFAAAETGVEAVATHAFGSQEDVANFSYTGTFLKNFGINLGTGGLGGKAKTGAKVASLVGRWAARQAIEVAGDTAYDTLRNGQDFGDALLRNSIANVVGEAGAKTLGAGVRAFRRNFELDPNALNGSTLYAGVPLPPFRRRKTAPAQLGASLPILDNNFVPDGTRVLQNLATDVNDRLSKNYAMATEVLTRREMRAAAGNQGVAKMHYGNAVERLMAEEIDNDAALKSMYRYVGGPNAPDFVGRGLYRSMKFDVTTPAQVYAHIARRYGAGLNVVTYQRPAGFP